MSIKDKKEEAEAVLDSAEMMLETMGTSSSVARDLKKKIRELEKELEEPDSESSLQSLIKEIRELMDQMQEEDVMDEPAMGPEEGGMGGGFDEPPEDDMPPF